MKTQRMKIMFELDEFEADADAFIELLEDKEVKLGIVYVIILKLFERVANEDIGDAINLLVIMNSLVNYLKVTNKEDDE